MVVGDDVHISAIIRHPRLVKIGSHVGIDEFTVVTTALNLGSYIHISTNVSINGGENGLLTMGDFTTISAGAMLICRSDELLGDGLVGPLIPEEYRDRVIGKEIVMQSFSALGAGAILFPNVWLAEGVVVGAGSLVTKPIEEPWTVWIGSPARKFRDRPREKMLKYANELTAVHGGW